MNGVGRRAARRRPSRRALAGQIVLIAVDGSTGGRLVTVDLLVGPVWGQPRSLCTFIFPVSASSFQRVLDVLSGWDEGHATVEVVIRDGRRGPQLTMSARDAELALELNY